MKIITTTILSLLAVLTVNASFDTNLKVGSRGEEVKKVQKYLNVEQTGYYGNQTKKAVATFQKSRGLTTSGLWLTMTRAEANKPVIAEVATSTPVVATTTKKVERDVIWNFQLVLSPSKYSSLRNATLLFTPTWTDTYTLAPVTRCEWTTNAEEGVKKVDYSGNGQVQFQPVVDGKYFSQVICVAFTYENGVYKEYKSEP